MKGIGMWSFMIGLLIAIVVAIFSYSNIPMWAIWLLVALGLVVGILNVSDKEAQMFLIATIAFLMSFTALGVIFNTMWAGVGVFFQLITAFIAPAAFIVAVKTLISISKN